MVGRESITIIKKWYWSRDLKKVNRGHIWGKVPSQNSPGKGPEAGVGKLNSDVQL